VPIAIREMEPIDIAVCRLLLSQLGYDLNLQEMKRRYDAIKQTAPVGPALPSSK